MNEGAFLIFFRYESSNFPNVDFDSFCFCWRACASPEFGWLDLLSDCCGLQRLVSFPECEWLDLLSETFEPGLHSRIAASSLRLLWASASRFFSGVRMAGSCLSKRCYSRLFFAASRSFRIFWATDWVFLFGMIGYKIKNLPEWINLVSTKLRSCTYNCTELIPKPWQSQRSQACSLQP